MPGIYHQAGCCCGVPPCRHCATTKENLSLTFSGISFCTTCNDEASSITDWKITTSPTNPNDTFVLTQQAPGSPCLWKYTQAATGTFTSYNETDGTCLTVGSVINFTSIQITASVSAGPKITIAFFYIAASGFRAFRITLGVLSDCTSNFTIGNYITTCVPLSTTGGIASGGSVTGVWS